MDPKATVRELCSAILRSDYDDTEMYADALYQWLQRGGFVPSVNAAQLSALVSAAILGARALSHLRGIVAQRCAEGR